MVPACNENDVSPGARQLRTEISACATCSETHNTHGRSSASGSKSVTGRLFSFGQRFPPPGRRTGHTDPLPACLVAGQEAREVAGDGKAEPGSAETLCGRGIGLTDLLE